MEMKSLFLGQVGSESLTCTFRANYCSVCLFSVRDREKKGGGIEGRGAASTAGVGSRRRVLVSDFIYFYSRACAIFVVFFFYMYIHFRFTRLITN